MSCGLRLERLELTNYRKFAECSIDFDDEMTVLIGGSGSGKSSILDVARTVLGQFAKEFSFSIGGDLSDCDVRIGAVVSGEAAHWQRQYPLAIAATVMIDEDGGGNSISCDCVLDIHGSDVFKSENGELLAYARRCLERLRIGDEDLVLPIAAFYGSGRFSVRTRAADCQPLSNLRQNGYRGALDGNQDEALVLSRLQGMMGRRTWRAGNADVGENAPLSKVICNAVERCFAQVADCSGVQVTYKSGSDEPEMQYTDCDGIACMLPISRLNDGSRTTLEMVADIACRMAILNPHLGEDVLNTPGVILIDEVELHLHPKQQLHILQVLRSLFPKVQFIVSTNAPLVVSSVQSNHIRIMGKTGANAPTQESFGLCADDALTGIMGAPCRLPEVQRLLDSFGRLIDEERYDKAEQVLEELEGKTSSSNPDVVEARSVLVFEKL